eukprot:5348970-Amphidinium_carterae.1
MYASFKQCFDVAVNTLELNGVLVQPHSMRHSGPSHDLLHSLRTMLEVKRRGRWASDSSLARYERHALVAQQWQRLPAVTRRLATQA